MLCLGVRWFFGPSLWRYTRGMNQRPIRKPIPRLRSYEARSKFLELHGPECHYCTRPLTVDGPGWSKLQIDHKVPVISGCTDDDANLVPACGLCNTRKGGRPYLDFLLDERWRVELKAALEAMEEELKRLGKEAPSDMLGLRLMVELAQRSVATFIREAKRQRARTVDDYAA